MMTSASLEGTNSSVSLSKCWFSVVSSVVVSVVSVVVVSVVAGVAKVLHADAVTDGSDIHAVLNGYVSIGKVRCVPF